MNRLMGLDIGDKRIGVALSDALMLTAQSLCTYTRKNKTEDLDFFRDVIAKNSVSEIVCGLPKNMDGTLGEQADKVKDYAAFLKNNLKIPLIFCDERLTTKSAEKVLLEADISRKKRKKIIDKVAAVFILQSYIDASHI